MGGQGGFVSRRVRCSMQSFAGAAGGESEHSAAVAAAEVGSSQASHAVLMEGVVQVSSRVEDEAVQVLRGNVLPGWLKSKKKRV